MKHLYAKGMLRLHISWSYTGSAEDFAKDLGIEFFDLENMYMIKSNIPEKIAIKMCMLLKVEASELFVYANDFTEALHLEYRKPSRLNGWRFLQDFRPLLEKGIIKYEE